MGFVRRIALLKPLEMVSNDLMHMHSYQNLLLFKRRDLNGTRDNCKQLGKCMSHVCIYTMSSMCCSYFAGTVEDFYRGQQETVRPALPKGLMTCPTPIITGEISPCTYMALACLHVLAFMHFLYRMI
jgi:hypothetical protein